MMRRIGYNGIGSLYDESDAQMKTISAIVPCLNEQESIPLFYAEICRVADAAKRFELEIIFVDDGSKDGTLRAMRDLAQRDARVRYISFSRNFGKESAMLAGLRAATGDYIAFLDADLQHPPALLPEMFDTLEQDPDTDVVAARRDDRTGESKLRSWFSRLFYRLMNKMSSTEIVEGAQDFRLMRRCVADAILSMGEYNRFSKGIFSWVGFHTKWITHENPPRAAGESKWSFWSLLRYSIEGIVSFSTKPLTMVTGMGIVLCLLALVMLAVILVRTLIWGDPVKGWPEMICVILFLSGIQLFSTGVLGQYLAKTYMEVKHRPAYLVRETEAVVRDAGNADREAETRGAGD